jgi:flagellar protein FlaH
MPENGDERKKMVVSTGNAEIDTKMGGGIPIGSLTLIEGDSHSGKSVLAQQMLWGSLHDGFQLSLFTTENTVKSLVTQMQSLNIDILDFLLLRKLRVYPMEVARLGEKAVGILLQAMKRERDRDMVFVDSLTPCIVHTPVNKVLGYFEECKRLCSDGMTIVTIIHSHAVSQDLLIRITSLCDAHLRLRTEEVGERLVKMMEVAKIRGASKSTGNIVSFEIEPGWGMKVIPISRAKG